MNASPQRRESWTRLAFGLGGLTAALLVFLGSRPGGAVPVLVYLWGLQILGLSCAIGLFLALLLCVRRRPVLQRGRTLPLSVLAVSLWVCSLPIAYPSSHEKNPSSLRFRLPFEGEALVRFGGERRTTNPLLFDPGRRFGVCFETLDSRPLSVVAPARGRVVACGAGRTNGEHVVVEVDERQYFVLSGLEPGSRAVEPGDQVEPGQRLGRAPGRLFVHLQDDERIGRSEGIPLRFWHYRVDGREAESGVPVPPQRVSALDGEVDSP